jgi:ribosome-binding factor A
MRRVNEAIKQIVSETIPSLKDPRIGFVTVTGVDTTPDLDQATVWLSVFGPERERQATLEALEGAGGIFQGRINRELRLRKTPRLAFAYDAAVERGVRMTQLIDELAPAEAPPEDPGSDDDTRR